jgi:hypothetical protein
MFLAGFYLTTQLLKITRGWEAEGLEEEAKDHRNSNLEALGVAMTCSFH